MNAKLKKYALLLAILVVALVVFSPSIQNEFLHWDDNLQVTDNSDIKTLNFESIATFFSSFYVGMYQPLTTLSYAIDFKIAGLSSTYFHFINMLIHLLNVVLVYLLFRKITNKQYVVAFITIIFAIHPLQVESVSWISARSNMLYTLFYLIALIKYVDYLKTGYQLKTLLYTGIFFLLSILAKSTAVTFPVLLFVFDYFYGRKIWSGKVIAEKIPFLALSIAFGIVTILARSYAEHLTDLSKFFNLFERFLLACYALLFYFVKLIAPAKLSAFYNYPLRSNGFLPVIYYVAPFIVLGISLFLYTLKKHRKHIIFGAGLFFIPILLVLQIIPVGSQAVTERYMYFPMLGLLFLIIYFVDQYLIKSNKNKSILLGVFTVYLLFLATSAFQRTKIWKDTMTLFNDTLEKHSRAMTVRNLRGIQFKNNGEYEKALRDFNLVIQYYPNYADAYNNRGNVKKRIGDLNGAIDDFDKALTLDPSKAEIYSNKGIALAELGDINSAIHYFNQAIEKDPTYIFAYTNRAKAFAMVENYKMAQQDLSKALDLDPELGLAYFIQGMIKVKQQIPGACEDFEKAYTYKYFEAKNALLTYCK